MTAARITAGVAAGLLAAVILTTLIPAFADVRGYLAVAWVLSMLALVACLDGVPSAIRAPAEPTPQPGGDSAG